jgi:hypothetical protein
MRRMRDGRARLAHEARDPTAQLKRTAFALRRPDPLRSSPAASLCSPCFVRSPANTDSLRNHASFAGLPTHPCLGARRRAARPCVGARTVSLALSGRSPVYGSRFRTSGEESKTITQAPKKDIGITVVVGHDTVPDQSGLWHSVVRALPNSFSPRRAARLKRGFRVQPQCICFSHQRPFHCRTAVSGGRQPWVDTSLWTVTVSASDSGRPGSADEIVVRQRGCSQEDRRGY